MGTTRVVAEVDILCIGHDDQTQTISAAEQAGDGDVAGGGTEQSQGFVGCRAFGVNRLNANVAARNVIHIQGDVLQQSHIGTVLEGNARVGGNVRTKLEAVVEVVNGDRAIDVEGGAQRNGKVAGRAVAGDDNVTAGGGGDGGVGSKVDVGGINHQHVACPAVIEVDRVVEVDGCGFKGSADGDGIAGNRAVNGDNPDTVQDEVTEADVAGRAVDNVCAIGAERYITTRQAGFNAQRFIAAAVALDVAGNAYSAASRSIGRIRIDAEADTISQDQVAIDRDIAIIGHESRAVVDRQARSGIHRDAARLVSGNKYLVDIVRNLHCGAVSLNGQAVSIAHDTRPGFTCDVAVGGCRRAVDIDDAGLITASGIGLGSVPANLQGDRVVKHRDRRIGHVGGAGRFIVTHAQSGGSSCATQGEYLGATCGKHSTRTRISDAVGLEVGTDVVNVDSDSGIHVNRGIAHHVKASRVDSRTDGDHTAVDGQQADQVCRADGGVDIHRAGTGVEGQGLAVVVFNLDADGNPGIRCAVGAQGHGAAGVVQFHGVIAAAGSQGDRACGGGAARGGVDAATVEDDVMTCRIKVAGVGVEVNRAAAGGDRGKGNRFAVHGQIAGGQSDRSGQGDVAITCDQVSIGIEGQVFRVGSDGTTGVEQDVAGGAIRIVGVDHESCALVSGNVDRPGNPLEVDIAVPGQDIAVPGDRTGGIHINRAQAGVGAKIAVYNQGAGASPNVQALSAGGGCVEVVTCGIADGYRAVGAGGIVGIQRDRGSQVNIGAVEGNRATIVCGIAVGGIKVAVEDDLRNSRVGANHDTRRAVGINGLQGHDRRIGDVQLAQGGGGANRSVKGDVITGCGDGQRPRGAIGIDCGTEIEITGLATAIVGRIDGDIGPESNRAVDVHVAVYSGPIFTSEDGTVEVDRCAGDGHQVDAVGSRVGTDGADGDGARARVKGQIPASACGIAGDGVKVNRATAISRIDDQVSLDCSRAVDGDQAVIRTIIASSDIAAQRNAAVAGDNDIVDTPCNARADLANIDCASSSVQCDILVSGAVNAGQSVDRAAVGNNDEVGAITQRDGGGIEVDGIGGAGEGNRCAPTQHVNVQSSRSHPGLGVVGVVGDAIEVQVGGCGVTDAGYARNTGLSRYRIARADVGQVNGAGSPGLVNVQSSKRGSAADCAGDSHGTSTGRDIQIKRAIDGAAEGHDTAGIAGGSNRGRTAEHDGILELRGTAVAGSSTRAAHCGVGAIQGDRAAIGIQVDSAGIAAYLSIISVISTIGSDGCHGDGTGARCDRNTHVAARAAILNAHIYVCALGADGAADRNVTAIALQGDVARRTVDRSSRSAAAVGGDAGHRDGAGVAAGADADTGAGLVSRTAAGIQRTGEGGIAGAGVVGEAIGGEGHGVEVGRANDGHCAERVAVAAHHAVEVNTARAGRQTEGIDIVGGGFDGAVEDDITGGCPAGNHRGTIDDQIVVYGDQTACTWGAVGAGRRGDRRRGVQGDTVIRSHADCTARCAVAGARTRTARGSKAADGHGARSDIDVNVACHATGSSRMSGAAGGSDAGNGRVADRINAHAAGLGHGTDGGRAALGTADAATARAAASGCRYNAQGYGAFGVYKDRTGIAARTRAVVHAIGGDGQCAGDVATDVNSDIPGAGTCRAGEVAVDFAASGSDIIHCHQFDGAANRGDVECTHNDIAVGRGSIHVVRSGKAYAVARLAGRCVACENDVAGSHFKRNLLRRCVISICDERKAGIAIHAAGETDVNIAGGVVAGRGNGQSSAIVSIGTRGGTRGHAHRGQCGADAAGCRFVGSQGDITGVGDCSTTAIVAHRGVAGRDDHLSRLADAVCGYADIACLGGAAIDCGVVSRCRATGERQAINRAAGGNRDVPGGAVNINLPAKNRVTRRNTAAAGNVADNVIDGDAAGGGICPCRSRNAGADRTGDGHIAADAAIAADGYSTAGYPSRGGQDIAGGDADITTIRIQSPGAGSIGVGRTINGDVAVDAGLEHKIDVAGFGDHRTGIGADIGRARSGDRHVSGVYRIRNSNRADQHIGSRGDINITIVGACGADRSKVDRAAAAQHHVDGGAVADALAGQTDAGATGGGGGDNAGGAGQIAYAISISIGVNGYGATGDVLVTEADTVTASQHNGVARAIQSADIANAALSADNAADREDTIIGIVKIDIHRHGTGIAAGAGGAGTAISGDGERCDAGIRAGYRAGTAGAARTCVGRRAANGVNSAQGSEGAVDVDGNAAGIAASEVSRPGTSAAVGGYRAGHIEGAGGGDGDIAAIGTDRAYGTISPRSGDGSRRDIGTREGDAAAQSLSSAHGVGDGDIAANAGIDGEGTRISYCVSIDGAGKSHVLCRQAAGQYRRVGTNSHRAGETQTVGDMIVSPLQGRRGRKGKNPRSGFKTRGRNNTDIAKDY